MVHTADITATTAPRRRGRRPGVAGVGARALAEAAILERLALLLSETDTSKNLASEA